MTGYVPGTSGRIRSSERSTPSRSGTRRSCCICVGLVMRSETLLIGRAGNVVSSSGIVASAFSGEATRRVQTLADRRAHPRDGIFQDRRRGGEVDPGVSGSLLAV